MIEQLNAKEIKRRLEEIQPEGFNWSDTTDSEMIKFLAIAQEAHQNALREVYDWGNEYCSKFSCLRRHCDHCWQELKKQIEEEGGEK